jgi:hypothetical protein
VAFRFTKISILDIRFKANIVLPSGRTLGRTMFALNLISKIEILVNLKATAQTFVGVEPQFQGIE